MISKFFKVVAQGEVTQVQSSKSENGVLPKCYIRLKELGGNYADEFICTMFDNLALCKFEEGDVVLAVLRFGVHEVNGSCYQDVVVKEIIHV